MRSERRRPQPRPARGDTAVAGRRIHVRRVLRLGRPGGIRAAYRWAREAWEALRAFAVPGVVLNYTSDTGEERVRSTFATEKYARLVALKRQWDPDNVFHSNQSIGPG